MKHPSASYLRGQADVHDIWTYVGSDWHWVIAAFGLAIFILLVGGLGATSPSEHDHREWHRKGRR